MPSTVEVRVYKAKRQHQAAEAFAKDAAKMANLGYVPVGQSWAEGRSGCLRLLFMGFIFAIIIKPAGSLTVTYRLEPTPAPPSV